MNYQQWLQYNIDAEESLLKEIGKKHGNLSKEYKKKLEQIKELKIDMK